MPFDGALHYQQRGASLLLGQRILQLWPKDRDVAIVCVGTDRSTGDSLGPLVGDFLRDAGVTCAHGTLQDPIHAANIVEELPSITAGKWTLAVDSCLGRMATVGFVSVLPIPLSPGAGVNRCVTKFGDASITGTVNVGGFMERFVLQNTRLSLVMGMAHVIADAIYLAALEHGFVNEVAGGKLYAVQAR